MKALFLEISLIVLPLALAVGNFFSIYFGWYSDPRFDWIDIPLHFLGGVFVVLFFWWLGGKYQRFNLFHNDFLKNLIVYLSLAALVGVLWEFFEFSFDYFFVNSARFNYLNLAQVSKADTMADLFFDLVGGFAAGIFLSQFNKRKNFN